MLLISLWAAALKLLPVRWLLPADRSAGTSAAQKDLVMAVRGAIRSAAARLPFRATCLAQSLAASSMLRRRKLPHALHIGARKAEEIEAHAWVEAAGLVVAGEGDVGSYAVLLTRHR